MKKFRYFILVLCMVLLIPVRTYAAVTPTLTVSKINDHVFLTNTYTQQYNITEDGNYVVPDYSIVTYEGSSSLRVKLTLNEGMYYNGTGYFDFSINIPDSGDMDVQRVDMKIEQDSNIEGVSYSLTPETIGTNQTSYTVRIQFQNFCATSSSLYLPFSFHATMVSVCNNTAGNAVTPTRTLNISLGSTGLTATELSSPLELNGVDGFTANQNQTMIEQNQTMIDQDNTRNTRLTQIRDKIAEIGTNIVTSISEWGNSIITTITTSNNALIQTLNEGFAYLDERITTRSKTEVNKMQEFHNNQVANDNKNHKSLIDSLTDFFTPYFDNITDAFKKALSDTQSTDNDVLSGAMDDYQAAEQVVFSPAMDSLTEFDFESHNISSLGTGFVAAITFVSSCLTNMYDLTPFSVVFEVIATLGLASICIGLSRLWFGKKGR